MVIFFSEDGIIAFDRIYNRVGPRILKLISLEFLQIA